jgi:DNA-binding response OmpR family regulator
MADNLSVRSDSYSVGQMLAERSDRPGAKPPAASGQNRLRVGIIDCDSGLVQVLLKRLEAIGAEHRVLSSPPLPETLVGMRLNALVLDPTVAGPESWDYLDRVCRRLPGLAVVVCTAPSSVAQRVRGLRLGVDAWITKPCHPEELIAVVEAALRRHRRDELPEVEGPTEVGELTIRPERHQAYVGETSVELTSREFEILQLLSGADRVLRREEIYERVWGYAMAHGDRSVDVFVRKLRQKLHAASPGWEYIHTHFGVGYRFAPTPDLSRVPESAPGPRRAPEAPVAQPSALDS